MTEQKNTRRKPAARKPAVSVETVELLQAAMEQALVELEKIKDRLDECEKKLEKKRGPLLQKVEAYNGEQVPEVKENFKMGLEDKVASVRNAISILPPNLMVEDRHLEENVSALCGFRVGEDLLDLAYERMETKG